MPETEDEEALGCTDREQETEFAAADLAKEIKRNHFNDLGIVYCLKKTDCETVRPLGRAIVQKKLERKIQLCKSFACALFPASFFFPSAFYISVFYLCFVYLLFILFSVFNSFFLEKSSFESIGPSVSAFGFPPKCIILRYIDSCWCE